MVLKDDDLSWYVKGLLRKYNIRPKKSLGQTFTISKSLLLEMTNYAEVGAEDTVLEVGAGLGCLTRVLAEKAKKVLAVEVDRRLVKVLRNELGAYKNIEIIEGDFLEMEGLKADKVVSTIPYSIASPLTFKLLKDVDFKLAVLVYQKEFAERLVAKPGTRSYGRLTVAVSLSAEVKIIRYVPRFMFYPIPDVDSAMVLIKPKEYRIKNYEEFLRFIRILFSQRNKILLGVLRRASGKGLIPDVNEELIPHDLAKKRVRELSLEELFTIYRAVHGSGRPKNRGL